MILIFHSGVPMRRDARWTNPILITAAAVASMVSVAGPAFAQKLGAPGAYGVVRAGAQLDSDLKFPKQPASPAAKPGTTPPRSPARTIPPGFSRDVDAKAAFTGELGAGYDFGGFRLEGTVGYGSAKIDASTLGDRANVAGGRVKSLDLGISGYADLNPGGRLNPFVGAGIGASRVDASVSRVANPTTPATPAARRPGTRLNDRDWGFRWHLDAGLGYQLNPATTLELMGRYSQTSALSFDAKSIAVTGTGPSATATTTTSSYKPKLSSTSLMLGLRQKF